ncbi:TlpA family protein disulfide reductase [Niabella sp. 22666]|uniref:TlpA family protein disulfide reductase n=1 Tax=Niabella sp. 22666 TaxID=3453954 RepID=UPI003F838BB9
MKFLTLLGVMVALCLYVNGQTYKALKVGDKVPDISLTNLYNNPTSALKLSDLKGKYVILDFWEPYCSSCLEALVQLEHLQAKYSSQMQVITLVSNGTKEKILAKLQAIKPLSKFSLPIAFHNDFMYKLFPHEIVSHVIWIDPTGKIAAITGSKNITERNIIELLEKGKVNWQMKVDASTFDYNAPLLSATDDDNQLFQREAFYSVVTGHKKGIAATNIVTRDTLNGKLMISNFNETLLQLCNSTITGAGGATVNPKYLILETPDPSKFIYDSTIDFDTWYAQNSYCYSAVLPYETSKEDIRSFVRANLAQWLQITKGVSVTREKRMINSMVITKSTHAIKVNIAYKNISSNQFKTFINSTIGNLTWFFNHDAPGLPPAVDETGLSKSDRINVAIPLNVLNHFDQLQKSMAQQGLLIRIEPRLQDVLVVKQVIHQN